VPEQAQTEPGSPPAAVTEVWVVLAIITPIGAAVALLAWLAFRHGQDIDLTFRWRRKR
jgi:hypothetical protein